MRINIMLGTDNDAFQPHQEDEVARILADLAGQIRAQGIRPGQNIVLRDLNGNRVGVADVFKD